MKVPLFRLQGNGDHFYTTSAEERDSAVSTYGYEYEGIACYVSATPEELVTLRDDFALSIVGHLAAASMHAALRATVAGGSSLAEALAADGVALGRMNAEAHAKAAYVYADAMLRARSA